MIRTKIQIQVQIRKTAIETSTCATSTTPLTPGWLMHRFVYEWFLHQPSSGGRDGRARPISYRHLQHVNLNFWNVDPLRWRPSLSTTSYFGLRIRRSAISNNRRWGFLCAMCSVCGFMVALRLLGCGYVRFWIWLFSDWAVKKFVWIVFYVVIMIFKLRMWEYFGYRINFSVYLIIIIYNS